MPASRASSTLCFLAALVAAGWLPAQAPDFGRDVFPILERACFACHGPRVQRAGLRLDARALVAKGGRSGPVLVPGQAAQSLLVKRVTGADGLRRMPLEAAPLEAASIATIAAWIDAGAPWPAGIGSAATELAPHWAFVPPRRHEPPAGPAAHDVRNPIDAFVVARLAQAGLAPSPPADRRTLLRRVTLDLVGLLPEPAEAARFAADDDAQTYEAVVDRLLASPHFGERQALAWLDAARYADSSGYSFDNPRTIWPWRDWVVNALNQDLPYDRFLVEQLAGDLLPGATLEQRIATGFHRNSMHNEEGGVDPEEFRIEAVKNRVDVTGSALLGLTIGCAQCHDHKYDPLSQRDYYGLYAFFNDADDQELVLAQPEERTRHAAVTAQLAALRQELASYEKTVPKERRAADAGRRERQRGIDALKRRLPKLHSTLVLAPRPAPRTTHLHVQGDFTRAGEVVAPGTPAVLPPLASGNRRPSRLDLARWLVDPGHPLTARVAVNRIWQHYFGRGLVETENDFGTQGTPPTHPELLDWLATELVRQGWRLKVIHRLIVTSATYRQSAERRPDLERADPRNELLGRQHRLRLDAETLRDAALAASGLLDRRIGGPPVFPPQPEGVMDQGQVKHAWKESTGADRYRRALYTFRWRMTPHPALAVFDAPSGAEACTRRHRSSTPLQALTLLNDVQFFELAQGLARRLLATPATSDADRLALGFELCLGRRPEPAEITVLERLLRRGGAPEAAWTDVARTLLNLDEFLTRG